MAKIKICGLYRDEDIEYVNESRPDYAGFVFAKSHRQITPETAERFRKNLSDEIVTVGVFVDAPLKMIKSLYDNKVIALAQLHGNEDEEYINQLKNLCDIPIIKAIRVETEQDIKNWNQSIVDFLLLDNGSGGTGQRFNWSLIRVCKKRFFLAGGINLSNIKSALKKSSYCIDVSSGAESNKCKDKDKIHKLVNIVRENTVNEQFIL